MFDSFVEWRVILCGGYCNGKYCVDRLNNVGEYKLLQIIELFS